MWDREALDLLLRGPAPSRKRRKKRKKPQHARCVLRQPCLPIPPSSAGPKKTPRRAFHAPRHLCHSSVFVAGTTSKLARAFGRRQIAGGMTACNPCGIAPVARSYTSKPPRRICRRFALLAGLGSRAVKRRAVARASP